MDWGSIFLTLAGVSTVLGLVAILAGFLAHHASRAREQSIRDIAEGEGFSGDQVVEILKTFQDEGKRLAALQELERGRRDSVKKLYEKIKGNIDLEKFHFSQRRYSYQTLIVLGVAFILLAVIAVAASTPSAGISKQQYIKLDEEIVDVAWERLRKRIFSLQSPAAKPEKVTVWEQFFERGYVIYDVANSRVFILSYDSQTYRETQRVWEFIRSGDEWEKINWKVVRPFLDAAPEEDRKEYERLLYERKLVGGIGTVYFREHLYQVLGNPVYWEECKEKTCYAETPDCIVYVGLSNRPNPYDRCMYYLPRINKPAVAAITLFKNGQREGAWQKMTVMLDELGYTWERLYEPPESGVPVTK